MLKILVDENKCVGCGRCAEVCPKGPRIWKFKSMGKNKKAVVVDASFCIYCGMCVTVCPTEAIKIEHSMKERDRLNITADKRSRASVIGPSASPE